MRSRPTRGHARHRPRRAVRFLRSDVTARVAAGKLYAAVQEGWANAPEMAHPPICCQGGRLLEPPLPHMKTRA
jgi:hypothetical protein